MSFLIIVVFSILAVVDCARILTVIPTPSISHQVPFRPITQELARRGHEVVVITTDPVFPKGQAPEKLTEIDVHDLSYEMCEHYRTQTNPGSKDDLVSQVITGRTLTREVFISQMKTNELNELIQNKNNTFDLLLLEAWAKPTLLLSHFFNTPVILVSSFGGFFGNYETVGAPIHPLVYPLSTTRQRINNLTLWEKMSELYTHYNFISSMNDQDKLDNQAIWDNYGDHIPPLSELEKNVEMLFLNVHPIWDGNRPVPPNVVYMGGVDQKPVKELPKELESYLNSSKHGVIYVSFGTNVSPSLLSPTKVQAMVNVFSQLPYDVLWKWDKDDLPGKTKNIRISKWLPQSDMLKHPKIKLFITQGGLQSTDEAIIAGVPLVGIPMLGDQWYNVEKYVQLGIGRKVEMDTLTSEALKEAVEGVINDESYRKNMLKFRSLMHDQSEKPLDRAIWWIEHVLRHGGASHYRSPLVNTTWAEFLVLDVVLVLLLGALTLVSVVGFAIYYLYVNLLASVVVSKKLKKN